MQGAPPTAISRKSMKRKAFDDTSTSTSFCSSAWLFGPAIDRPTSVWSKRWMRTDPSPGRCFSNQRMWYLAAAEEPQIMKRSSPALAMVKSPISLPNSLSIGVSTMRPTFGMRLVISRLRNSSAPGPDTSYLAKLAISVTPTLSRVFFTSLPTCSKSLERWKDTISFGSMPFGANHSGVSSPQLSPMTAFCATISS